MNQPEHCDHKKTNAKNEVSNLNDYWNDKNFFENYKNKNLDCIPEEDQTKYYVNNKSNKKNKFK